MHIGPILRLSGVFGGRRALRTVSSQIRDGTLNNYMNISFNGRHTGGRKEQAWIITMTIAEEAGAAASPGRISLFS